MTQRLDPDERRKQLLSFGEEHFAEHGYDAMSVDEIAELAGVSKGTLYKYFGGRRGFYVSTIAEAVDGLLGALDSVDARDPADALVAMTSAFVGYAVAHDGIYLALVRGGLGADVEVVELLESVRTRAAERVFEVLELSASSPRLELAVAGWVAFVEATTARWIGTRSIAQAELVELLTRNLIDLLEANR